MKLHYFGGMPHPVSSAAGDGGGTAGHGQRAGEGEGAEQVGGHGGFVGWWL